MPRFLGLEHLPPIDQYPDDVVPREAGVTIELMQMGIQLVVDSALTGTFPAVSVRRFVDEGALRVVKGAPVGPPFTLSALTCTEVPHRRVVDPNMALKAAAIANMAGSQAGNQSHITGCMKSGIAIAVGAQTRNATLINGILMFLGIYFTATRDVLNHVPLVALSAFIGYAGYRLCALGVWKHFWHLGPDPFMVFALGFLISVFTGEILYGFFGAMAIEFCVYYRRSYLSAKRHEHRGLDTSPRSIIRSIFRNPVVRAEVRGGVHVIEVDGALTPFNRRFYPVCPAGVEDIFLDCDHHRVTFVDYSWQVQCQKDRVACCGKSNFKVNGFRAVSRGAAPGLYRYERRSEQCDDDAAIGRRQSDLIPKMQEG